MQEEVTRKTIALAIKTAKLDGKVLQAALRKLLQLYRKARDTPHRGKQTLKQLMRHGTGVSNFPLPSGAGLQAKGHDRDSVDAGLCAPRRRLVSAQ